MFERHICHRLPLVVALCAGLAVGTALAQPVPPRQLIFSDAFDRPLDTAVWKIEVEPLPGAEVRAQGGKLLLHTAGGVTVWLNKILKGNIRIEYTRRVVVTGNPDDRLSDMNQFWMATDAGNRNLFTRTGKFSEYDGLTLYYASVGGNNNSTTRFRKYDGTSERPLLQEYTDAAHLLKAGHTYHIRIDIQGNTVRFFVDGNCYFDYTDAAPLREGYFGFRSTRSRQEIDDVKIFQMTNE